MQDLLKAGTDETLSMPQPQAMDTTQLTQDLHPTPAETELLASWKNVTTVHTMPTSLMHADPTAKHQNAVTKSLTQVRNVTAKTGVLQFALEILVAIITRDLTLGNPETCNLPFVSLKLALPADHLT
jgi:hypothetical protein